MKTYLGICQVGENTRNSLDSDFSPGQRVICTGYQTIGTTANGAEVLVPLVYHECALSCNARIDTVNTTDEQQAHNANDTTYRALPRSIPAAFSTKPDATLINSSVRMLNKRKATVTHEYPVFGSA